MWKQNKMLKVVSVCAIVINVFLISLADSDITCWKYPASSGLEVSYSNDNKVNSTAKFQCSAGMTLIGNSSSVCQHNGTWSNLWPICENSGGCHLNKLALPNLLIDPVKENYHFGDSIALSCSPGHKLTGNSRRVICLGDSWSDDLPVCIEKAPSRQKDTTETIGTTYVPSTTRTVVSTSLKEILQRTSPAVPSVHTAQTTPIFEITTTTRTPFVEDSLGVKLDEVTSSATPKVVDCSCEYPINDEKLVAFVDGKRLQFRDKVTDGAQVVFRCKNLFFHRFNGPLVNKCENCGSWHTTVFPTCSELRSVVNIRCPEIDGKGVFGIRYSGYRRINSTAMFYCKDHLQILKGRNFRTCQQNGEWSGTLPTCVDLVPCGKFEESPGLEVSYSNDVRVGTIASFQCQPPSTLLGSASAICRSDGTWSHPLPKCEVPAASCSIDALMMSLPIAVIGDMTSVTEEIVEYGTNIPLLCEEGLLLIGSSKAKCERRGKWEFGNVQCVPGCKLDDDVSSDVLIEPVKEFYRFGESISIWCPPGQELTTSVMRVMCLGSSWSDKIPDCIEAGNFRI